MAFDAQRTKEAARRRNLQRDVGEALVDYYGCPRGYVSMLEYESTEPICGWTCETCGGLGCAIIVNRAS